MAIFAVTTNIPTQSNFLWFYVETEFATIDDLDEALAEDGFFRCTKLEIDRTTMGRSTKRIIGREDRIIGVAGIVTITPTSETFEEGSPDQQRNHARV